jgi:hypothetical protein
MSIQVMTEVWKTDLPTTEKMVLLAIADHASDDGTNAYPSQATIAKKASISIRTVQRCVNNLVKAKYLRMDKGAGGSANCREDRRPHLYTINLDRLRGDSLTGRKQRVVIEDEDEATLTPTTGRQSRPMNHPLEPSLETPNHFVEFWKIYPLKVAKKTAEIAFNKALKSATADEILSGAKRYASDPNRHPSYTAHPTTWLNQGRWGDEALPHREMTPEERKAVEAQRSREASERDREKAAEYLAELERQREQAVPMPQYVKDLLKGGKNYS